MATSKIEFQGSKISPSESGAIYLNVLYKADGNTVMVAIPNNTWMDTQVLFNDKEIDMMGEYTPIINKVVKAANKLFPNWQV